MHFTYLGTALVKWRLGEGHLTGCLNDPPTCRSWRQVGRAAQGSHRRAGRDGWWGHGAGTPVALPHASPKKFPARNCCCHPFTTRAFLKLWHILSSRWRMKTCPFPSWSSWQKNSTFFPLWQPQFTPIGGTRLFSAPHKLLYAVVSKAVTDLAQA